MTSIQIQHLKDTFLRLKAANPSFNEENFKKALKNKLNFTQLFSLYEANIGELSTLAGQAALESLF